MMKEEFEERIGGEVRQSDYDVIEYVYTWHPAISNTEGKDQIAQIYQIGGMAIVLDMLETAEAAADLEKEMREAVTKVNWIKERQEILASSHRDYGELLKEIEKVFNSSKDPQIYEKELDMIAGCYPNYDVRKAQKMIGC